MTDAARMLWCAISPARVCAVGGANMESVFTASAFFGAALVGLAGNATIAGHLQERRWLRVAALATVFLLIAAILTGSP